MRQESKRKGNALDGKRKPTKMKFSRLVNWGEDGGSPPSSQLEELGLRRTEDDGRGIVSKMKGNSDRIDEETAKMVNKTSKGKMKKKKEMEDKMKKKSFEFRQRGKLTKK